MIGVNVHYHRVIISMGDWKVKREMVVIQKLSIIQVER